MIDAEIFENDAEFDSEVKVLIDHIPTEQVQRENTCDFFFPQLNFNKYSFDIMRKIMSLK